MNILVGSDDKYLFACCTMVFSLTKHTKEPLNIYFMEWEDDKISLEHKNILRKSIRKNDTLSFLTIPPNKVIDNINMQLWNRSIFLRVLAPYYLPDHVDKYIYIDSDIIIKKDISDIYKLVGDYCLYGIQENNHVTKERLEVLSLEDHIYLNSGFLVVNKNQFLKAYPTINLITHFIKKCNIELSFPDQDLLNVLFDCKKMKHPNSNYMHFTTGNWSDPKQAHIYHYTATPKPWDKHYYSIKYGLYFWKYGIHIYKTTEAIKNIIFLFLNKLK